VASQPPPYGYGPPGQQMPPPASGAPAPGYGSPAGPPPGPPPAPPFGGGSWGSTPTPPTPPKRNLSALWVVLGAVVVAALVAGAVVIIGGGSDGDSADTTEETRPRRTTTTIEEEPTTTTVEETTVPPSTTVPDTTPAGESIDLTHGVFLPLPEGWDRTDTEDDEVVQISDGTLKVDAQALQRTPGEDPAAAMQEYIDLFDTDFAVVGYSPVTLRSTMGDNDELRNYGVYYRAIDADFTGFDGAVYVLQRTDGLTIVLDYYAERPSESAGLPEDDYQALIDSILAAPALDDPATIPESAPFRVTTVHPYLTVDGLAALTLPPGWVDQSVPGATIGFDGTGEWAIATKVTAQPDADAAIAAVQADLGTRYPGLIFEAATTVEAWADLERRDANIATPGDPAVDPRPRYGAISVFYDPATQNAFGFTLLWYGDVTADGSEPSPDATDFIYDVFTDSFDTIP
jgi:hypothetical protein